jgi:6-phosphofructokinase 1
VHGLLIGEVRGDIVRTPLDEVAGRTRPADTRLIELARVLAM